MDLTCSKSYMLRDWVQKYHVYSNKKELFKAHLIPRFNLVLLYANDALFRTLLGAKDCIQLLSIYFKMPPLTVTLHQFMPP